MKFLPLFVIFAVTAAILTALLSPKSRSDQELDAIEADLEDTRAKVLTFDHKVQAAKIDVNRIEQETKALLKERDRLRQETEDMRAYIQWHLDNGAIP